MSVGFHSAYLSALIVWLLCLLCIELTAISYCFYLGYFHITKIMVVFYALGAKRICLEVAMRSPISAFRETVMRSQLSNEHQLGLPVKGMCMQLSILEDLLGLFFFWKSLF